MWRLLLGLAVTGLVATGAGRAADEKAAEPIAPSAEKQVLNEREEAFAKLLTNAALVGSFTVETGKGESNGQRHRERYVIQQAVKVGDDSWLVHARIVYGKLDVTVPVPVKVHWANDTPVLSVTDLTIPLVGSEFTARVMFFDDRYAGTWRHGKVGGLMFGAVERAEQGQPAAPESRVEPEKN